MSTPSFRRSQKTRGYPRTLKLRFQFQTKTSSTTVKKSEHLQGIPLTRTKGESQFEALSLLELNLIERRYSK